MIRIVRIEKMSNILRRARETTDFNENDETPVEYKTIESSRSFVAKMQEEAAHRQSSPLCPFLSILFPFLHTPDTLPSASFSLFPSLFGDHKTRVHFYAAFTVLSRGSFSTQEEASPRSIPERVRVQETYATVFRSGGACQ